MNESLFFLHILVALGFGILALKRGKTVITAWIALQAVLANLFVLKQIDFFGFHVTCSDVFAVGSIFGLNLLREYFGKKAASQALWACFFSMGFFVVMAQIHLLYAPNSYDTAHPAFSAILSPSWRLLSASIGVFFLVQQIDLHLFGWIKKNFYKVPFPFRNGISVSLAQFLDTFLFSVLGLWGLVTSLSDIILVSFLIKLLAITLMTPLVLFSKRYIVQDTHASL